MCLSQNNYSDNFKQVNAAMMFLVCRKVSLYKRYFKNILYLVTFLYPDLSLGK